MQVQSLPYELKARDTDSTKCMVPHFSSDSNLQRAHAFKWRCEVENGTPAAVHTCSVFEECSTRLSENFLQNCRETGEIGNSLWLQWLYICHDYLLKFEMI